MMRPEIGERAALFDDPLFGRNQEWKLSTSALSAGDLFRGTGWVTHSLTQNMIEVRADGKGGSRFGAPYHDGYGINCESFSPNLR